MIRNSGVALLLISLTSVWAQNTARGSEVVARVNGAIITKADLSIALNDYREPAGDKAHPLTEKATDGRVDSESLKRTVLDALIDGLLLEQRARELGLDTESEFERIIDNPDHGILPGYRDALDSDDWQRGLRFGGKDPQQSKAFLRKRILQQYVIQREIVEPIYAQIGEQDRRDYYRMHRKEFEIPARLKLSEVFLPFDDSSEPQVESRAYQLLVSLRSGADFVQAVEENSSPSRASRAGKGYIGSFALDELRESVLIATSKLEPGEFTEPIRNSDGYQIIRLDARIDATLRNYDDPYVQIKLSRSLVLPRAEDARKEYISALRKTASIVYSTR